MDEVQKLLKKGVDPNQCNCFRSAIDNFKQGSDFQKNLSFAIQILKLLLANGADPLMPDNEDSDSLDYEGADHAFEYALAQDVCFECFILLYENVERRTDFDFKNFINVAARTYDSNIVIFLIKKGLFDTDAGVALEERVKDYFDDQTNAQQFLLTPFYQSVQMLYALIKNKNSKKLNQLTLCELFQLAMSNNDFSFSHEIIQQISHQNIHEKINYFYDNNSFIKFLEDQSNVIPDPHQTATLLYLYTGFHLKKFDIPYEYKTLHFFNKLYNKTIELLNTEKETSATSKPFHLFFDPIIQELRQSKLNSLLTAVSDLELKEAMINICMEKYIRSRTNLELELIKKFKFTDTLNNKSMDQLRNIIRRILDSYSFVFMYDQNLIEVLHQFLTKISPYLKTPLSIFKKFKHCLDIIDQNYRNKVVQKQPLPVKQLFLLDENFYLYRVRYAVIHRLSMECDLILQYKLTWGPAHVIDSPQTLIDSLKKFFYGDGLNSLKDDDLEWFTIYLKQFCLKTTEPQFWIDPPNQSHSKPMVFLPCDRYTILAAQLTPSQKNIFLRGIINHSTKKTLFFHDQSLLTSATLNSIHHDNYHRLIHELRYMEPLPKALRYDFLKKKGYFTLLSRTEPEILTAKEKPIYQALIESRWIFSHHIYSSIAVKKIDYYKKIYSLFGMYLNKVYPNSRAVPANHKNLEKYVFLTVGPAGKAPTPPFLRDTATMEIDIKDLLKAYPDFLKYTQLSFHWAAFEKNQAFNPTNYADSTVFIYHANNRRYSNYFLNNKKRFTDVSTFSQGFYNGERLFHLLSLLFILQLRYIGGDYCQYILDHPSDLELLGNTFCEIFHSGVLELQCLLEIPINSSYARLIPSTPAQDQIIVDHQAGVALQDIQSLQSYLQNKPDLNQDIILRIANRLHPGNLLAKAIVEDKSKKIIELILNQSTIDLDPYHMITLNLALANKPDIAALVLNHKFSILSLPACSHYFQAQTIIIHQLAINFSILQLPHLLSFVAPSLLTNALQTVVNHWKIKKTPVTKEMIHISRLFLENGALPLPALKIVLYGKNYSALIDLLAQKHAEIGYISDLEQELKNLTFPDDAIILNIVIKHFNYKLTCDPHLYRLLIFYLLSSKMEFLSILLTKMHHLEFSFFKSNDSLSQLIHNITQVTKEIKPYDIYLFLDHFLEDNYCVTTVCNADALALLIQFINNDKSQKDLLQTCVTQHWFKLLTFLLERNNLNSILYLIENGLESPPEERFKTLCCRIHQISSSIPHPKNIQNIYEGALKLYDFPELIVCLLTNFSNLNTYYPEEIVLELYELMLNHGLNTATHRSWLNTFFINENIEDVCSLLITAKNNSFLNIAKLLLILESVYLISCIQETHTLANYIKSNSALFSSIDKLFNIPVFTLEKLKILFYGIDPNKFPLPPLSKANSTWAFLNKLLPQPQKMSKPWEKYYHQNKFEIEELNYKEIGVGIMTCLINNEKYVYLGYKKVQDRKNNPFYLMAPGGFINSNEEELLGTLREIREETSFNLASFTNFKQESVKENLELLGISNRLDLHYLDKTTASQPVHGQVSIRLLYEYDTIDDFNRFGTPTRNHIYFYWLDFDVDISQHFRAQDDFENGKWIPVKGIQFDEEKEKFYYDHCAVAMSNALLIQWLQGIPIPDDAVEEAIYNERYQHHKQKRSMFLFSKKTSTNFVAKNLQTIPKTNKISP